MSRESLAVFVGFSLIALFSVCTPSFAAGASPTAPTWIATWGTPTAYSDTAVTLTNVTVRHTTHIGAGGSQVRIRISNTFGIAPAVMGHATIALSAAPGSSSLSGAVYDLTFNGSPSVTIAQGADVLSDAANFTVPNGANLTVSLYFPNSVVWPSTSNIAQATSYTSTTGDHTDEIAGTNFPTSGVVYYMFSGIDVSGSAAPGAIVALGDSITEGYGSIVDGNGRWPDDLANRLFSNATPFGMVDMGIGGNRLLLNGGVFGINGLARMDHDALAQSGVKDIILALGINDLAQYPSQLSATQFLTGYQQFVAQAHALGYRVIGATITPAGLSGFKENTRRSVNSSIRAGGIFDAYVDFDAAIRDPGNNDILNPAYNSGDGIHPNTAGYQAMANEFDLTIF